MPLDPLASFPDSLRDRYTPKRQLGVGSMGRVFMALDNRRRRLVAVKVLPQFAEAQTEARLEREAQILSQLKHPNILRVFGAGRTDTGPYLVTEYLRGLTLADTGQPPDLRGVALQVADGLDAVHAAGLLHRDVKPANVFATNKGRIVLMDFGLALDPGRAKLTSQGGLVGTMNYMSPEAMRGDPVTPASDWYSWGATVFYLLEGRVPFARAQIIGGLTAENPPEPEFKKAAPDSPAAAVLRRSLRWDPADRPASAAEIRAAWPG